MPAPGGQRHHSGKVCPHPAANAIIQAKLDEAKAAHVRAACTVRLPLDLATPSAELCAVIANAFDNALNACRGLARDERWIEFSAREAHGFVAIEMRNACVDGALPKGVERVRAAGARDGALPAHGWGLSIIEGVARRHAGSVEYGCEGGVFSLSVIWELEREGDAHGRR